MAKLNPQGIGILKQRLSALALEGAHAGAEVLADKLGGEGTGTHHLGLPNRSSTPEEYPAQQSGELRDSIGVRRAEELRAEFGPVNDPPDYVVALHMRPPGAGGRPFVDMAFVDEDIHAAIRDAVGAK